MRKRYKVKRRSCDLCKPNKRGHDVRWSPKELARLKLDEREMHVLGAEEGEGVRDSAR